LAKNTNYETPHYAVFSSFLSLMPLRSKHCPQHAVCKHKFLIVFFKTLMSQGDRIAAAAYASDWFEQPVSFQKSVGLIMLRAQRPVVLTLGPFGTLSLELFAAVSGAVRLWPSKAVPPTKSVSR
jgi:hypothetical protein